MIRQLHLKSPPVLDQEDVVNRYKIIGLEKISWGKFIQRSIALWGVTLCLIAVITAGGCTNNPLPTPSEMTSIVVIRQSDARQTFTAHTGDRIEVLLDENPSTGYSWQVTGLDRNILVSSDSSFYSGGAILGRGGTRKFQFEVKALGETTVSFRLSQPWNTEAVPIEQFQVTIRAVED